MNITFIQKFDKTQFLQLEYLLKIIKLQNIKIMATQKELADKLAAQKVTIDGIAASIQPTSDQADPALEQAVTDLGASVDALKAKVNP
jgi:hypothetical protein